MTWNFTTSVEGITSHGSRFRWCQRHHVELTSLILRAGVDMRYTRDEEERLRRARQAIYVCLWFLCTVTTVRVKGARMKTVHDIFLRAFAVAADQKKRPKRSSRPSDDLKWPKHALVFDTETRITVDQSLTFGVYRCCERMMEFTSPRKKVSSTPIILPAKERKVLQGHRAYCCFRCSVFSAAIPTVFPHRIYEKSVLASD